MTEEDEAAWIKKVGFDGLYALDDDDEKEDIGLRASFETLRGKTLGDPTAPFTRRVIPPPGHLFRSLSSLAPIPPSSSSKSEQSPNPRRPSARQLLDEEP